MAQELTINDVLRMALEYHQKGDIETAKFLYEKILEADTNHPDALHLLGVIAYQNKEYENSVNKIEHALKFKTSDAGYYINLGLAYNELGKEEESMKYFKKSLEIDPSHIKSHVANFYLGIFHRNLGKFDQALQYYNKAIELNKNLYDAYWNRGILLLLLGRFEEGWKDYEYRFKREKAIQRNFNRPRWNGEIFENKKLLIATEQGLGDSIQFIRYISRVKERGGEVILECQKGLMKLFENFPGVDKIVESGTEVDFDFYIYITSLPSIFNTNLDNIPDYPPYIRADPILVERAKKFFNTKNFKIGISWAGSPNNIEDKKRSVALEKFKKLFEIPGVDFFSLQKGEAAKQIENSKVIDLSCIMNDLPETAAIIENLDLVISVDTSIAHLAGAMGKPCWTLIQWLPDWRYLLDRKDSPWYKSMKLFRQPKAGDWDSVFDEVGRELKNL